MFNMFKKGYNPVDELEVIEPQSGHIGCRTAANCSSSSSGAAKVGGFFELLVGWG